MKKKFNSSDIDYSPYSQSLINNNNNSNLSKNRNTITILQPHKSKNYFRLYKEHESNPTISQTAYNNNNKVINSLNEKIYSDNSKKLGEYYSKNKEDISLYGSKKYDLLTVDNLVQEMKQYKNSIIEKMKLNPSKFKLKNYGLKNSNANLILTPLAEKERSKMGNNEKELFNLAERRGVVMRRMEYSNSLYNDNDDLKIFLVMKNAVKLIEKCWLFYKGLKKRKLIKGIINMEKFIKRKILRLFNDINNERLKNIYMSNNNNNNNNNIILTNSNFSSISFKNNFNLKNSNNSNINSNSNERYNPQDKKNLEICSGDKINIIGKKDLNNNKSMDDLQKKYYKLILDYKMIQGEVNKYKNENFQLKNKINILINENKELNELKSEKNELLKKFDELNINYNNLLKDFDTLNANNSNLLSNQSLMFNSIKKENIPIIETDEYISLQNEYNSLNDKYNKTLEELDEMKRNNDALNNMIIKNNEIKNSYVPIDEETINEINEYKNKIEELNNQLLKQEKDYEIQINKLNENINNLIKDKENLNKNINELKIQISTKIQKNDDINYINQIKSLENKIKNFETQIKQCNTKIKEKEDLLKNKDKDLIDNKNKIKNYEKIINDNKNKEIQLTNKIKELEQNININKPSQENNKNVSIEIDKQKANMIKYKQDMDNLNIKLNETQKKLNSYLLNNNQLKEENSKNKITISKLNNLIIGLNNRIKQLLEENKNLRDNKKSQTNYTNKKIPNKLFILYLDKIINKKILVYKYQLMINLFQENINNFTKYIIYQNNSVRSSINLDGYEKVITGESKKIITKENDQNNVTYDNKIIIHKDLDDTLKNYIIKGKDNLTFDEIFEEEKRNDVNNPNELTISFEKK